MRVKDLITQQQLCERFGISPHTIHACMQQGMPYRTIGKRKKFYLPAVLEWLSGQEICETQQVRDMRFRRHLTRAG